MVVIFGGKCILNLKITIIPIGALGVDQEKYRQAHQGDPW